MIDAAQIRKLPKGEFRIETPNLAKGHQKILRQVKEEVKEPKTIKGTLQEVIDEFIQNQGKVSGLTSARRQTVLFKIECLKRLIKNKEYYWTQILPQDPTWEITRLLQNGTKDATQPTATN